MSADFSRNYVSYSPNHQSPPGNQGQAFPFRNADEPIRRRQVPGSLAHHGNTTSPKAMPANNFQVSSSESQMRQSGGLNVASGGPVLHLPAEQDMRVDRNASISPSYGGPLLQSPIASEVWAERRASRSPNLHIRTPSQLDKMAQENAQLRQELEDLRMERDQTQNACDNMLTALMTAQDSLQESQVANAEKEAELSVIREQLTKQSREVQGDVPDALVPGGGLSRSEKRELRDLRLKCSRLVGESERKDEQLKQARAGMLETNTVHSPHGPQSHEILAAQQQLRDAEERAAQAAHQHQGALRQADTYREQIMGWKRAYDALQEENTGLQRSHAELSRAAGEARTKVDEQAVKQLQASHTAEVDDARKLADFFKKNSEQLSRKNKAVTDQIRSLQDALNSKEREIDQQKSFIEALQLQIS